MPKLTGLTLLKRALPWAIEDRLWMLEALGESSEDAQGVRESLKQLRALKPDALGVLSAAEARLVFAAFVWAQQWQEGIADAHHGKGEIAKRATRHARLLREYRQSVFGLSAFERAVQGAKAVDLATAKAMVSAGQIKTRLAPGAQS